MLSAYDWSNIGRLSQLRTLQRWWYTLALYFCPGYRSILVAIMLLDHPLELHSRLWHTKRPIMFVSRTRVHLVSSSFSQNSKLRSASASKFDTSSWRVWYIEHVATGLFSPSRRPGNRSRRRLGIGSTWDFLTPISDERFEPKSFFHSEKMAWPRKMRLIRPL